MIILRFLLNALSLIIVSQLVPGFTISSTYAALILALVLGLLNALVRPVLLVLTLPVNIVTLGLFTFVINALMILFAATMVKGVSVDGFGTALVAAIILWLISLATNALLKAGEPV